MVAPGRREHASFRRIRQHYVEVELSKARRQCTMRDADGEEVGGGYSVREQFGDDPLRLVPDGCGCAGGGESVATRTRSVLLRRTDQYRERSTRHAAQVRASVLHARSRLESRSTSAALGLRARGRARSWQSCT
jgi:hypothetical protein